MTQQSTIEPFTLDPALAQALAAQTVQDRLVAVLDSAGRTVLSANERFCVATGCSAQQVVATPAAQWLSSGEDTLEALVAAACAKGGMNDGVGAGVDGSLVLTRPDGSTRRLSATLRALPGGTRAVSHVLLLAEDITDYQRQLVEGRGIAAAVDRSQARVEFDVQGRVLSANTNFLTAMGYALTEIQGKHHRMFCDPSLTASYAYQEFWDRLGAGEFHAGEYKRLAKGEREIWLQATYNPVMDADGTVLKIVKFASDITQARQAAVEAAGKVDAIERSQAVVEFDVQGRVLTANGHFLDAVGYTLDEVAGEHHRMFCDPDYTATAEYSDFWEALAAGKYTAGEYRRFAKGGREIWLQATYNPVKDADGTVLKIVKFASDITEAKLTSTEVTARMVAVDRAQAVVEFDLDGHVLTANDNFLRTMGYSLREIVGQHHSTFCTAEYTRSPQYRDFWMRLAGGEFIDGRFHRVGKYSRDVHIQATYAPIHSPSGDVVKVVKYAYDITTEVVREQQLVTSTGEMTAAVRNLTRSIEDIANSSSTATDLAQETHANAEQGVEALRASLEAIQLIQRSSNSISKIVRVMGEIASQTNLLAFNASIEAARAGEHGIGFSIVAGEVRKLAERSSEAAQQIATLIAESEERVEQGSEVSKRAELAFERIVSSVAKTNDAVRTISGATRLQQDVSQTVNVLISRLVTDSSDG